MCHALTQGIRTSKTIKSATANNFITQKNELVSNVEITLTK